MMVPAEARDKTRRITSASKGEEIKMAKTVLLFALTLVLLAGLTAGVQAQGEPVPQTTVVEMPWTLAAWTADPNTGVPYLRLPTFTWRGDNANDGEMVVRLTGPAPCANDPDVYETVTNSTPVPWTDWHVDITNGIIEEATVRKINGPSWFVDVAADGSGFDAYTALQSGRVSPGEDLDIWFRYTVAGSGDIVIDEYPTTGYIPEPSSLVALLSAVAAMGLGVIKRKLA